METSISFPVGHYNKNATCDIISLIYVVLIFTESWVQKIYNLELCSFQLPGPIGFPSTQEMGLTKFSDVPDAAPSS